MSRASRASPGVPDGPLSARRTSKSPVAPAAAEDAAAQRVHDEQALVMATQSVAVIGPPNLQEAATALASAEIAPRLLEQLEFVVNTQCAMQAQMADQQRILEFMCNQLGTKLGMPSLTKFKPAATPLTDGRPLPGPKDANPRAMVWEELCFLKHFMDSKQMRNETYAKHVLRILAPMEWWKPGFRLQPRLDLASPAQLWKLWHLTHECYDIKHLQGVCTNEELRASESPLGKKEGKKALTHASAATDAGEHLLCAAHSAGAASIYESKQMQQEARRPGSVPPAPPAAIAAAAAAASSSASGRRSPCDSGGDSQVGSADLFGNDSDGF